jgi:hypothetical protein
MNALTLALAALSLLTLLALVFAVAAFCQVRAVAQALKEKHPTAETDSASALQVLRADLESLAAQIRDTQPPQILLAGPPRGLNLARRSQALRLNRHGNSPSQIAATLEIPLQEVELLLKVDRIVLSNL